LRPGKYVHQFFAVFAGHALVGWYLMLLPMGSVESRRNPSTRLYDYSTQPLNTWEIERHMMRPRVQKDSRTSQSTSGTEQSRMFCICLVHHYGRSAP